MVNNEALLNISHLDESYSLKFVNDTIVITANSSFGAIRGLSTMSMLPYMSDEHKDDEKYYDVKETIIDDSPATQFRAYVLDGAGKFLTI